MKLGTKVLLGFGIVSALLLAALGVYHAALRETLTAYRGLLADDESMKSLSSQIGNEMLIARRGEKDFLLRKNMQHPTRVHEAIAKVIEHAADDETGTTGLIEESVQKAREGTSVAGAVGSTLGDISRDAIVGGGRRQAADACTRTPGPAASWSHQGTPVVVAAGSGGMDRGGNAPEEFPPLEDDDELAES